MHGINRRGSLWEGLELTAGTVLPKRSSLRFPLDPRQMNTNDVFRVGLPNTAPDSVALATWHVQPLSEEQVSRFIQRRWQRRRKDWQFWRYRPRSFSSGEGWPLSRTRKLETASPKHEPGHIPHSRVPLCGRFCHKPLYSSRR